MNKNFLKTYKKDVNRINSKRNDPTNMAGQPSFESNRNWKESIEIFDIENTQTAKTARVDTSKIKLPDPPNEVFPAMKTFLEGRTRDLPDDMFHTSYNQYNFPSSYGRTKLSFDDITIPAKDAFGVETALGEKNYQLINHRTLQKDVDFTAENRSSEDVQISADLIKEEKQAKRKKHLEQKYIQKPNQKYVLIDESEDQPPQTTSVEDEDVDKNKTALKTQIIEKITKEINQNDKKEISKEELDELMKKYEKDITKRVEKVNEEINQENNQKLTEKEKQELTQKETLEMMTEIQGVISTKMMKQGLREAASK